jgi:excisionase family DNA binding protein
MKDAETLWSIKDAAAYLGVPVSAVYKMTSVKTRTAIPHVKLGGRLRFRKADIDRWLDLLVVSNLEILAKAKRLALRG